MIPIVISVLEQLKGTQRDDKKEDVKAEDIEEDIIEDRKSTISEINDFSEKPTRLEIYLLLCVPFSANQGSKFGFFN